MSDYELVWTIFHVILGLVSYTGIIVLLSSKEPPIYSLSFKTLSDKHPEAKEVLREGRWRGCEHGNPMIVYGFNEYHAQENLTVIREALKYNKNVNFSIHKRDFLVVELRT